MGKRRRFKYWGIGFIALYVLFTGCCGSLPYQPNYIMAGGEEDTSPEVTAIVEDLD